MVATLMAVHGHAAAADFNATWDASSGLLPDAVCPAWALIDTASPEEPTLSNGILHITTSTNEEDMISTHTGPDISVPGLMIIEARLRFVSGITSHVARAPGVVAFSESPTVGNSLYIGADEVFLLAANLVRGASATVDTDDAFHTYRIEVNTSTGAVDVFYDGSFLMSGNTFSDPNTSGSVPRVAFGEGSSLATGTTEWEFVRHNATSVACVTPYSCTGFEPPFDVPILLKAKVNRAIPLQMQLSSDGTPITDANIAGAPPVVNVTYSAAESPAVDVTDQLEPVGQSSEGNVFTFDPVSGQWDFHLGTKPFKAAGTYTVTVAAGDTTYSISPACTGQFVRSE